MPYVNVFVDAADFLEELSDKELQQEIHRRREKTTAAVEDIYLEARELNNAGPKLREFIYQSIGRIL